MRAFCLILALIPQCLLLQPMQDTQKKQYLLMQPIQDSLKSGNFSRLETFCQKRISVNIEAPFSMQGYFEKKQFSRDFSSRFSRFSAETIEWGSMQVEENLAVQSLNIRLLDRSSRKTVVFKLIFFMIQVLPQDVLKEKEWKLYYLRGLKL